MSMYNSNRGQRDDGISHVMSDGYRLPYEWVFIAEGDSHVCGTARLIASWRLNEACPACGYVPSWLSQPMIVMQFSYRLSII